MYVFPAASTVNRVAVMLFSYTRWAACRRMASRNAEVHAKKTRNCMPESEQLRFHDKSLLLYIRRHVTVAESHASGQGCVADWEFRQSWRSASDG